MPHSVSLIATVAAAFGLGYLLAGILIGPERELARAMTSYVLDRLPHAAREAKSRREAALSSREP